jgi:hypothetical protein
LTFFIFLSLYILFNYFSNFLGFGICDLNKWGLGIGDWGLGIGDWAQSPIPNPQSPFKSQIPNPKKLKK